MGVKGCWTCRARKVRCDGQKPECGNCTKSRRACQGYGMQLSWPRDNDRRRAIVSTDTSQAANTAPPNLKGFLNSSFWDISLSEEIGSGSVPARYLRTMQVPRPVYLSPAPTTHEESQLLGYFNESRSLVLGPTDEEPLAQFILRVAFSDPSDASNPVLQSVFAIASLQLHGSMKSFRYKHSVINSVKESINSQDERRLLQNLMATMLLYHYELSLESNSKGDWVRYLCAVKELINRSPSVHKLVREEYSVFLDWIYYHEVLGEFTIRHWKRPYEGCGWAPTARSLRALDERFSKIEDSVGCPTDVLQLVAHTCRRAIVSQPPDAEFENLAMQHSKMLEANISAAVGDYGAMHAQSTIPIDRTVMISDLHRLACLLYVNRGIHHVSGHEFSHKRLVREGIMLLSEMGTCQNAWPLFIIACEAADDEQRLVILNVFKQSQEDRRRRSSHIHFIQHMVEAVWNQLDLNVENDVDYLTIFDAVVGGVPFTPPFA